MVGNDLNSLEPHFDLSSKLSKLNRCEKAPSPSDIYRKGRERTKLKYKIQEIEHRSQPTIQLVLFLPCLVWNSSSDLCLQSSCWSYNFCGSSVTLDWEYMVSSHYDIHTVVNMYHQVTSILRLLYELVPSKWSCCQQSCSTHAKLRLCLALLRQSIFYLILWSPIAFSFS